MGDPFEFRRMPTARIMRRRVRWAIILNLALWTLIFLTMKGCLF